MTDTVTRLMGLADEYADASFEQGLKRIKNDERPEIKRQALEAELVRLFTPLSDEQLEVACSAAANCGNKRGVKSFDALAIVGAYLSEAKKHGIGGES